MKLKHKDSLSGITSKIESKRKECRQTIEGHNQFINAEQPKTPMASTTSAGANRQWELRFVCTHLAAAPSLCTCTG